MKNKLVMAMITVVLASECFAGCSKKTIENSAASNASVLEENEKEAENAKKTVQNWEDWIFGSSEKKGVRILCSVSRNISADCRSVWFR